MKKTLLVLIIFFLLVGVLFADLDGDTAPVTIPVFYPDSDAFFANRFQSASTTIQLPSFFFFDIIGDGLNIPKFAEVKYNDSSSKTVTRLAGAFGGRFEINDTFTVMAGISGVIDDIYIAESFNLYGAAGLFAQYNIFDLDFGIGVFGGYYWKHLRELPEKEDTPGIYEGIYSDIEPVITNAARFIFTPRIGMSDTDFFIESIGGAINVTEDLSTGSVLGDLAFKTLQAGFIKLNIDLYFRTNKYNLYMKDRLFGSYFATKYLSIDIGYRWFEPASEKSFLSNYQDGMYGKFIVKFPAMGVNMLLSYSFETTFETLHYIGIGVTLPLDGWRNDYLYEFAGNYIENMRFSGSNLTGW